MTIDEHESLNSFSVYLNTSYVSFLLFLPCFIVKLLYMRYSDEDFSYLSVQLDADVGRVLLAARVFNFLINLLSIIVLAKLATLTHSVINVTKRMLVVYSKMLFFSTAFRSTQIVSLMLVDSNLVLCTFLKLRMKIVLCSFCLAELGRQERKWQKGLRCQKIRLEWAKNILTSLS